MYITNFKTLIFDFRKTMNTSIDAIIAIFCSNSILYRYFLQYLDCHSLVQFAYVNKETFDKRHFILNLVFSQSYDLIRFTKDKLSTYDFSIQKLKDTMIHYNWIRGGKINVQILFQNANLQKKVQKCLLKKTKYILARST